ncbi:hypothetical protein CRV03_03185 [Arcobacter sp. F155]|nr:hypothetical protein CRV03_03185 [Arcobacter sp. F155]
MPNVVVNAKVVICEGVILNTFCVVKHERAIENFVHIFPKVALTEDVKVGEFTDIGNCSNVIQGIIIGKMQ